MKIEKAIKALREGKKVMHPFYPQAGTQLNFLPQDGWRRVVEVKTFGWEEALKRLLDGKRVARRDWDRKALMFFDTKNELTINSSYCSPVILTREMVEATDWYEVGR